MDLFFEKRPDPDELLASILKNEEKSSRGKLKIFFGMCAGVGKTYTMLQTAGAEKHKGNDIVIGYVETHKRKETAQLTEGLELIPRKKYEYKSTQIEEMDLDAILERKPHTVLVDELAHTNAPGSRHVKRYQDVVEILENGINVYTTLNVQHLESRSETVAQITGIVVRETVPDEIFENADEVEVVDITPDELLQRLSEGKVYTPEKSKEAMVNFFRMGNITAMREMALRIVADRVDKQLHDYLQENRIRGPWKSGASFLVAVDYHPQSARLLRWSKNLAYALGGKIQALYIETSHQLSDRERAQLNANIALAKQLKIPFRIITNYDRVKAIVDHALKDNATHIMVCKPRTRNLQSVFRFNTFVHRLIQYSGNIDVYVLGSDNLNKDRFKEKLFLPSFTSSVTQYLATSFSVVGASLGLYLIKDLVGYQVISFGLLFLVSILALFYGSGPIFLAATLSALIWDYFFIPPQFTLHIGEPVDVMLLIMFFIIALLNGTLTSRIRLQEQKIRIREERTNALYQLTKELNTLNGFEDVKRVSRNFIRKNFDLNGNILLRDETDEKVLYVAPELELTDNEISIANWVYKHASKAGKYTDTLPTGDSTFYPLMGNNLTIGVIAVTQSRELTQGEDQFWEACLSQISAKFEREFLRGEARKALVLNESDKLYKTLFNSISHELRIPVATIMGASETLMDQNYKEEIRMELFKEINTATIRLNRLIENLLNMSRLESGRITPRLDWCDVHDLINAVTTQLQNELKPFKVSVIIPQDVSLAYLDFGLTEQIIHNLVLNATQYAPHGSNIRIKLFFDNNYFVIQVMDRGKGFEESELKSVFEKFYRGHNAISGGTGLGLSIVKGFTEALKGTVIASNRQNGGALFTVKIPSKITDISTINTQI